MNGTWPAESSPLAPQFDDLPQQREALETHFRLMCDLRGEADAPLQLRKFGVRYSELHPFSREVKMAFLAVRSPTEWSAMLDRWYDPVADWPFPSFAARARGSTRTRNSLIGPFEYRRMTPNRCGRTHSNGCSSHSTGIPNALRRRCLRAFFNLLFWTI